MESGITRDWKLKIFNHWQSYHPSLPYSVKERKQQLRCVQNLERLVRMELSWNISDDKKKRSPYHHSE